MTAPAYRYEGGGTFTALPRFRAECDATFIVGAMYRMEEVRDRSLRSHNHEFAWLAEAWKNLPEHLAEAYPTPEHLRKRALIDGGWFDEMATDAGSNAAAVRVCAAMKAIDDFALVFVRGPYVIRRTAKSQSRRAMGAKEFQASKEAVMDKVAEMIGVPSADLHRETGRAA